MQAVRGGITDAGRGQISAQRSLLTDLRCPRKGCRFRKRGEIFFQKCGGFHGFKRRQCSEFDTVSFLFDPVQTFQRADIHQMKVLLFWGCKGRPTRDDMAYWEPAAGLRLPDFSERRLFLSAFKSISYNFDSGRNKSFFCTESAFCLCLSPVDKDIICTCGTVSGSPVMSRRETSPEKHDKTARALGCGKIGSGNSEKQKTSVGKSCIISCLHHLGTGVFFSKGWK